MDGWGWSSGFVAEAIKGSPRFVRELKRDLHDPNQLPCIREESEYGPETRMTRRTVYRDDGSVSYRWTYEYDENNELSTTSTFDADGRLLNTRIVRRTAEGTEERVIDASGNGLERSVLKEDKESRITDCMIFDGAGNVEARQTVHNDVQGRPVSGQLVFGEDEQALHFEVQYLSERHTIITFYQPDGSASFRSETVDAEPERQLAETTFVGNDVFPRYTTERIDARDSHGNWIRKTIFETKPGIGAGEAATVFEREIQYWDTVTVTT